MTGIIIAFTIIIIAPLILIVFFSNNSVKRADRHTKLIAGYDQPFIRHLLDEIKGLHNYDDIIKNCHEKASQQFQSETINEKHN
tara:strand:+ start:1574 stop:1825 length:252 start_codon:yes stop_codon:yes gene_type:complete